MRSARWIGAVPLVLGALAGGSACSRSTRGPRPVASLPSTPAASAAFLPLRAAWEERRLDGAALRAFLARYPEDGAAPLVTVYLAFALLDAGQLIQADGVLASIVEQPPGTTRDLANVARARSLRLHRAPQSALDYLRPLVGKVVDDVDREVFLEELALSAIAAHDDYEALAYLDAWLRGVSEDDRERVRAKIAQILETLPRPVLEQTYRAMRKRGASSGYGLETQTLVASRLARIAVEANDAALARWLLDESGTSAREAGGDAGVELGELASSKRGLSVVSGQTIGLLLPTRDRELRDEAADVVRGVSWALDLPRAPGRGDGVRLVTREDGVDEAGTRAAMEELAGEGAVVILAGFDRASADRASAWSEQTGMPVLLLAGPSAAHLPRKGAFVLGERAEREMVMLVDALIRHGVTTAATVVEDVEDENAVRGSEGRGLALLPTVRCNLSLADAGKTRFPFDAWFASGARGWLVSGPRSCTRDVLSDLARAAPRARASVGQPGLSVGLTLEAGVAPSETPPGVTVLSASAGVVPVLASRAADATDPDVRAYMTRFGGRPSYWTAIGRDGGALARAALAPLPTDTTSDPKAVAQRRAIAQAGLLGGRVHLWTTDERGFGADRILPRALRIVTWKGGGKP